MEYIGVMRGGVFWLGVRGSLGGGGGGGGLAGASRGVAGRASLP